MAEHPHQEINERFNAVLALPEEERASYLKRLSSESTELHHEVVDLLANYKNAAAGGFLDSLKMSKETHDDLAETIAHMLPTVDVRPDGDESQSFATLHTQAAIVEESFIGEIGDYQLIEKIGRGGMGIVYKAHQKNVDRIVALKVIAAGSLSSPEDIVRFRDEATAAGRLRHSNIVSVFDAGEHNGNHFFSMAYIDGENLANYVGPGKPRLKPREAARLMEKICRAAQYAHDHLVIHRDIKPANIMLDKSGEPLLADFGLAKLVDTEGLTQTGQTMGTANYMAPEQARGQIELITGRTDVYSLGGTLYALLKGRHPIEGKNFWETIKRVENTIPESLHYRGSQVPLDLSVICDTCLAKRPEDRYDSAAALADDLKLFLEGFPITARPVTYWGRFVRWSRRNPAIAGLISTVAATLVIATIVSIGFAIQARSALAQKEANAQKLLEAIEKTFIIASENLADIPGMQDIRMTLLESAQRYYEEMLATEQISPEKVSQTSYRLGKVQFQLGLFEKARESLNRSLDYQSEALPTAKDQAQASLDLAAVHSELAKLGEKVWGNRASDNTTDDDVAALKTAIGHAQQAIELRAKAFAVQSDNRETGRLLASAKTNLGVLLNEDYQHTHNEKSLADAQNTLNAAQTLRQKLLEEAPNDTKLRQDLARGFGALARLCESQCEWEKDEQKIMSLLKERLKLQLQAVQALEDLPETSRTVESQSLLATCYRALGRTDFQLGKIDDAIEAYEKSIHVTGQLTRNNPRVYSYREQVALAQYELAQILISNRDDRGYLYANDCQQTLVDGLSADPLDEKAANLLVELTNFLAIEFKTQEFYEKAEGLFDTAKEMLSNIQIYGSDRSLIKKTLKTLTEQEDALSEDRTT